MKAVSDWLKQKATTLALTAATVIALLQLILPALFDLIFAGLMIGLIWIVAKVSR